MSDTTSVSEIGRRLRDAAHGAGLTLRELGDRMGVSRPTIYAYASGALKMSPSRLRQAAEITGHPVSFFEPQQVEDLDPRSTTVQSFKLIDALLSPPSPAQASSAALEALEFSPEAEAPGIRAELLRRSGNALTMSGDYVAAVQQLESAKSLFESEGLKTKSASCAQTLGVCYINLGQVDRAMQCFVEAQSGFAPESRWKADVALAALAERIGEFESAESQLSRLLDDPNLDEAALTYIRANYSSIVCTRGRWKSGLAQTETALNAALAGGQTDQVAEMLIQSAFALTFLGRLEEATLMVVRARDVSFATKDEARSTLTDVALAYLLAAFGDESAARSTVAAAYARALRGQYRRSESQALLLQTDLAYLRGDDVLAFELATQTRSHAMANRYVVPAAVARCVEAKALARMGRSAEADACLDAAEVAVMAIGDGRPAVLLKEARAVVKLYAGLSDKAIGLFVEAIEQAESLELVSDAVRIGEQLTRVCEMTGDTSGAIASRDLVTRLTAKSQAMCPNPSVWMRFLVAWPTMKDMPMTGARN